MAEETTPSPAPAKATDLPPLAKYALSVLIGAIIAFLGARYGITPAPTPGLSTQSAPQPIVIVVGGQPSQPVAVTGAK